MSMERARRKGESDTPMYLLHHPENKKWNELENLSTFALSLVLEDIGARERESSGCGVYLASRLPATGAARQLETINNEHDDGELVWNAIYFR